MKPSITASLAAATLAVALASCDSPQQRAATEALDRAQNRQAYVPRNSLDFINYDKRQRKSDDPTTIVWCTIFPADAGRSADHLPYRRQADQRR
jgi:hypothetical protein